jgi:acetyltransferase-like isoleucine patch superfamily enzyme
MKAYFDSSIFANPLTNYLRWLRYKIYYQCKYWGQHLRISYGSIVRNTIFGRYNWIGNYNTVINCQLGNYSYIAGFSTILNCRIGNYCAIATGVKIAPGKHPTSGFVSIHPSTYTIPNFHAKRYLNENKFVYNDRVEIGNDVWIGANAVIVDGIKIGDGAIVAANSVVTKNVGDFEIVGGTPARLIRTRFSADKIAVIKESRWWDKDEAWMQQNLPKFWSVTDFVAAMDDKSEGDV